MSDEHRPPSTESGEPDGPGLHTGARERSRAGIAGHAWLIAPAVIILLCYSPVLLFEYGFSEDYRLLAAYDRGAGFQPLMIAEGRPLFALWARLVFGSIHGIGALALVRFLNIALLAVLAIMLAAAWRRAGLVPWTAALAGAATMTLPPFQLFAATAAMGAVPVGAVAAGTAAFLTVKSVEVESPTLRWRYRVAAFLLVLAGLATYQPAGLFYWVFAAILLMAADIPWPAFRRRSIAFLTIGALAMVLEFGIYLAGRSAHAEQLLGAPRADLTFDPMAKGIWFLLFPLPHALNLWRLRPNLVFAMVAMIVVAAGIVLLMRRQKGASARIPLAFILLPLCTMPNLFVVENRSSFRSMPALAAIVFSFYVIVIRGQFTAGRRWVYQTLLTAAAVIGPVWAGYNVVAYIAAPQTTELELVRATVAALPPSATTIGVKPSDYRETLAPGVLYDEFGYPSTALPWSVFEVTYLVMREHRPALDPGRIRIIDLTAPAAEVVDAVIDWGEVLRAAKSAATGG